MNPFSYYEKPKGIVYKLYDIPKCKMIHDYAHLIPNKQLHSHALHIS